MKAVKIGLLCLIGHLICVAAQPPRGDGDTSGRGFGAAAGAGSDDGSDKVYAPLSELAEERRGHICMVCEAACPQPMTMYSWEGLREMFKMRGMDALIETSQYVEERLTAIRHTQHGGGTIPLDQCKDVCTSMMIDDLKGWIEFMKAPRNLQIVKNKTGATSKQVRKGWQRLRQDIYAEKSRFECKGNCTMPLTEE